MSDSYNIIDGQVVPYSGGRQHTDTTCWRDATELELTQQQEIEQLDEENAELKIAWDIACEIAARNQTEIETLKKSNEMLGAISAGDGIINKELKQSNERLTDELKDEIFLTTTFRRIKREQQLTIKRLKQALEATIALNQKMEDER